MKTSTFWIWTLGCTLAVSPFAGNGQDSDETVSNAPAPEQAEQNLENASGKIVSTASTPAADANVNSAVAEIVRLAQSGVDESVMLAYISNSANVFDLNSDQIIYLNDVGVSGSVVTAMMQHDQVLKSNPNYATTPPTYSAPGPGAAPAPNEAPMEAPLTPQPEIVENGQAAPNVSYTYFYDSLAPYGNWVDVEGCGLCWQPTVVVANPTWQPYCDRGHWVYSDCGWFWASDYSWGWAPFHYGRWFHNRRMGWCWAPDTVWGPSWVCWRHNTGYCGWAPLPPTACFTPGIGFSYYGHSVSFGFSFGLPAATFSFVSVEHFCDPHPYRYRLPRERVTQVFNNTTVINQVVVGDHNRIINRGIPVDNISRATHTAIHPVQIHETDDFNHFRQEHRTRTSDRSMTVFHPQMPQPTHTAPVVGRGVTAAPHDWNARTHLAPEHNYSRNLGAHPSGTGSIPQPHGSGNNNNSQGFHNPPMTSPHNEGQPPANPYNNPRNPHNAQGNQSLYFHGPNRPASPNDNGQLNPSGRTPNTPQNAPVEPRQPHSFIPAPQQTPQQTPQQNPAYQRPSSEQNQHTLRENQPRYTQPDIHYTPPQSHYAQPSAPAQPTTRNNQWSTPPSQPQATPRPEQHGNAAPQDRNSYSAPRSYESHSAPQPSQPSSHESHQSSVRDSSSSSSSSDSSRQSDGRNPRNR